MKQPPCPRCGSKQFHVRYTEVAHALVSEDGEALEDGLNLVNSEYHWDQVWCAHCNQAVKWQGEV